MIQVREAGRSHCPTYLNLKQWQLLRFRQMRTGRANCERENAGSEATFCFSLEMNYLWHDYRTERVSMLTKHSSSNNGTAQARVEEVLASLSSEDSELSKRLLDAAVAGAVVARQPADANLRAEATQAWNSIRPLIVNHLASQQEIILPWARMRPDFPLDLILRAHEQHLRLRHLAETVDAVSFLAGSDEEVVKAGAALTAFAVCLDDLIDGESRDLFPMIQRSLRGEFTLV